MDFYAAADHQGFLDEAEPAIAGDVELDPDEGADSAAAADPSDTDEPLLLERLRRGDEAAFEQMVRKCGGRLLGTARRLLGSEDEARDAVQEALLSAFRGIQSFSGSSKLSTWLHTITVNAARMRLRTRRRRPLESIEDLLPQFDDRGEWVSGAVSRDLPPEMLERGELRRVLRSCVDRLPESQRTVFILRDVEERDTAEVAETLGITASAVKLRLHRARQALRTLLERELPEEALGRSS